MATKQSKDLVKEALLEIARDEEKAKQAASVEAQAEPMRKVLQGFVDKRLEAYFDANPQKYLEMNALATLRNRIAGLELMQARLDSAPRDIDLVRANAITVEYRIRKFVRASFWARLKWLVFGGCFTHERED